MKAGKHAEYMDIVFGVSGDMNTYQNNVVFHRFYMFRVKRHILYLSKY